MARSVAAFILAFAIHAGGLQQPAGESGPVVICWPTPKSAVDQHRTEVGVLYTPELLATLAQRSPAAASQRVRDAIDRQTPIVVLWSIPPAADGPPFPRPFSAVIVDHEGYNAVPRTEPLWIEQHADDLRRLEPRRSFDNVGVMAAFPRAAFIPGRLVIIYRVLAPTDLGASTGVQRFGVIEWSGARP